MRHSKTYQLGLGHVVLFSCQVQRVKEFLAVRPDMSRVLLVHQDGSWLSRYQFLVIFRCCLRAKRLNDGEFCSHSFRIGAATEAAQC